MLRESQDIGKNINNSHRLLDYTMEKLLSVPRPVHIIAITILILCQVCAENSSQKGNSLRTYSMHRAKRASIDSEMTTTENDTKAECLNITVTTPSRFDFKNCSEHDNYDKDLYILVMAPFPAAGVTALWEGGLVLMPAAILAAKQINSAGILGDFRINIVELNSACSTYGFHAAQEYIQTMYHSDIGRRAVGMVGPACTDSSFLVGELNNRNPLVQFIVATSDTLRNRTHFPYILSTISSSLRFVDTLLSIALQRNWTRIGVILEVTDYFVAIEKALVDKFSQHSIKVTTFNEVNLHSLPQASTIVESDLRIIVLLATGGVMEQVLCELYLTGGLSYPAYQWILIERGDMTYSEGSKCTLKQTETAFEESILLEYSLQTSYSEVLVSNQTFDQYYSAFLKEVELYEAARNISILPGPLSYSVPYAHPYYDAVWALGLGLSEMIDTHNITELLDYGNDDFSPLVNKGYFTRQLMNALHKLEPFYGGSTYQNISGSPNTAILINQIKMGEKVLIGKSVGETTHLYSKFNGTFIEDHFNIEVEFYSLPDVLFGILLIIQACLLCLTVFFHFVNIYFRDNNSISVSSPRLNNLIFVGCYSMVLGIVIYLIGEKVQLETKQSIFESVYCYSHWVLIELGTTLMFATILCRTWRIYRIYIHFTNPGGKLLKDYTLMVITILLLIPTLLNTFLTLFDPFRVAVSKSDLLYNEVSLTFTQTRTEMCVTPIWHTIFFYLYTLFLLLCSFAMAFFAKDALPTSRFKVRVKRSVSFLLYSQFFITSIGYPLLYISQILHWHTIARNVVFCVTFSALLLVCTLFIFLPPAMPLFHKLIKPQGDKYTRVKRWSSGNRQPSVKEVVVIF